MLNLTVYAIPVFVLCIVLEYLSFRFRPEDDDLGYEMRDAVTNLSMGLGSVFVNAVWKIVVVLVYGAVYLASPFEMSGSNPWAWVLLFFADDLAYYWFHRSHHRIRLFWASHVVHHSSRYYNLTTALRQSWTPMTSLPFWIPLAFIGFPPWMILTQQSVSLIYQFFIHTERVGTLPRPIEWVMNTPSHHRVHHGSDNKYLDCNYAGILIVWDRMFGTFVPETTRAKYGLTTNIDTYNPAKVAFGTFAAIGHDVRHARTWRERLGYTFNPPGWQPEPVDTTAVATAR